MPTKIKHIFLGFLLIAFVACGTIHHSTRQAQPTAVITLADSLWTFSQTHPEGFTLNITTWEEPKEGISVAYSATQDCHDRAQLDFVINHAQSNGGYVGGWFDTVNGRYYFDSVRIFPEDSLTQAIIFGKENAQIAIFILSSGREIRLENTQSSY